MAPPPAKRHKTSKKIPNGNNKEIGLEMICPISRELPYDPVIADDGRIYERFELEQYFLAHDDEEADEDEEEIEVKSPVRGDMMSRRMVAAPQIKNLIGSLIESGVIDGDLADKWLERQQEQEEFDEARRRMKTKKTLADLWEKAERGDEDAIAELAQGYQTGASGFPQNSKMAFIWFNRLRQTSKSAWAMAEIGVALAEGVGVKQNIETGKVMISVAAGRGSDYGAYLLGLAFAEGKYGLPVDRSEAVYWLMKCLSGSCEFETMTDDATAIAQEVVDELLLEQA